MTYRVIVSPAARRNMNTLPESVLVAVLEFISGPLAENPQRVGKALVGVMEGLHSARRGTYRVIYRINETDIYVNVVNIRHRRDAYR